MIIVAVYKNNFIDNELREMKSGSNINSFLITEIDLKANKLQETQRKGLKKTFIQLNVENM